MENRIIAKIEGEKKGYEIILISGMHGNEMAGVTGVEKVINFIKKNKISVSGNITALRGNLGALNKDIRYIDMDLNRMWTNEYINNTDKKLNIYELKELKELSSAIDNICLGNFNNCVIIDFHSFSSQSGIFTIPANNQKSIKLAEAFQVQFVEKLTSDLKETAIQYYAFKGATALVFEGGQHYAEETEGNIMAAIYMALNHLKCVDKNDIPEFENHKERLRSKALKLPKHYELSYIHRIKNGNDFKMNQGYINFQEIKKDEILAYENQKPILSECNGRILMPLYQKKGNNGFYVIQEFK